MPRSPVSKSGTSSNLQKKKESSQAKRSTRESKRSTAGSVFESIHYLARQNALRLALRREKCVEGTQYKEAARYDKELAAILEEHEELETDKIQMKQMQAHLKLIRRQAGELQEFATTWNEKMSDFDKRVTYLRTSFTKEQRDAGIKHLKEIRSEKPTLKFSKQLHFLRGQAMNLARLEKYDEADFIKNEATKVEAWENRKHKAKCENVSRLGGKEWFISSQRNAKHSFEAKIELEWMRLNVAKRKETDQLLKRQANERCRFLEKMRKEKHEIAPLLVKE